MSRLSRIVADRRPDPDQTLVSVVVPVYNEQDVLETLVTQLAEVLEATPSAWELVLVNDGSRDASGRVLDWLAARHPRVRVVHLSRNFGHQAAVQAGLVECRGDAIVLMDADLQDAPEALPRLLAAWRRGADVVYAVRTDRKEHRFKRWAFAAFYRILAAVSPTPIPLDAGNFGLVDRRVLDVILSLGERDRFFPGLRSWVGFHQVGIPVERLARYDECPRVSLWGLVRLAKTAVFSFSTLPLSIFYGIGLAAFATFFLVGGYALACKLFTDLAIPGWTSHVLVGCLFGALNALGVSILGEYVVRIYDQVRGRPLYVVERRAGGNFTRGWTTPLSQEVASVAFAAGTEIAAESCLDSDSRVAEEDLCWALLDEAECLARQVTTQLAVLATEEPVES